MRYSRQEIFIGTEAQENLEKSLVTIVGCGGTGSAAAEYLARSGVNLRLVDRDIVETSNLQRQLYIEDDIGKPKAAQLKKRLEKTNSKVKIEAVPDDLNQSSIDLLKDSSIILDGTDNMETRFLVNDYCSKNKIPFTYAAAIKNEALFGLVIPDETACLRCFLPTSTGLDTCETAGIIGPVAGLAGTVSAAEAIKYLSKNSDSVKGKLFRFDFGRNLFDTAKIEKNENCKTCRGIYEFLDAPIKSVRILCGGTYQFLFNKEIDVKKLSEKLMKNPDVKILNENQDVLQVIYDGKSISLFRNRMIAQNVKEKEIKPIAARLVGI